MNANKLINDAKDCVDDSIKGFLSLHHADVTAVMEHRILIRKDIAEIKKKGQVTLLSGGGAGHEPAHMGYVGKGMLSAAISGNVFASPPTASILVAIRSIAKDNAGGCLLIVKNYTGDRLNFSLAMNKAHLEGINVQMVIVGDDCALTSSDKSAGRRGLCGTVLIHKIAGAMAENGCTLNNIVEFIKRISRNLGTISVSLSSCVPPGSKSSTFMIDENHMELGLGIHGEPGITQLKVTTARNVISAMLKHMTKTDSANNLEIPEGVLIVLMINNLGGLSEIEMNIVVSECLHYLDKIKANVARVYVGRLMTALDMRGASITVLHVDSTILDLLDQKTSAPAWPHSFRSVSPTSISMNISPSVTEQDITEDPKLKGVFLSDDAAKMFRQAVVSACEAVQNSEKLLNSLDCHGGDGDCGSTLAQGAIAIKDFITSIKHEQLKRPYHTFMKFGQITEVAMGGTSGALYSIFFTAAASEFSHQERNCTSIWISALKCGLNAVMEAGGAQPGDRTMVDPLTAAIGVADSVTLSESNLNVLLTNIVKQVNEAVESTRNMKAQVGRASYVSKDKTENHCDAGATAILILFKGILEAL